MPKKSIVVIGSSNTDMIVNVARIPKPGETVLGGKFHTAPGGKGANQAVAAQRAGGDVTFIASVGNDAFGEQSIAGFAKEGINIAHISRDKTQPSGIALIFVGADAENGRLMAPACQFVGQIAQVSFSASREPQAIVGK